MVDQNNMTIKTCSVYIVNSLLTCFVNFETRFVYIYDSKIFVTIYCRATFSNMGVKLPDLYWNTSNPMWVYIGIYVWLFSSSKILNKGIETDSSFTLQWDINWTQNEATITKTD